MPTTVLVEYPPLSLPFALGFADGLESPFDLGSGLTWADNDVANEDYDSGVNVGQNLMRLLLCCAASFRPSEGR